ncbi:MAG: hypothetical protein PQJ46_16915, partial [Spirochaetales bacterium]|nr:hypothetical protein [Spirochaetales bacterium]
MIAETFIPGNGLLYKLDARAKFIFLLISTVLLLVETSLSVQVSFLLFLVFLIAITLGVSKILVPIRSILPVIILTAILTPLF